MALSDAIMKGQWPPRCLPPIMWSQEASSVSIERAPVWLRDNVLLLARLKQTQQLVLCFVFCVFLFFLSDCSRRKKSHSIITPVYSQISCRSGFLSLSLSLCIFLLQSPSHWKEYSALINRSETPPPPMVSGPARQIGHN